MRRKTRGFKLGKYVNNYPNKKMGVGLIISFFFPML